jgi:hypothetical protein
MICHALIISLLCHILAADLHGTGILVNSGWSGRPVEDGAKGIVWAATLPDNGLNGGFLFDGTPAPHTLYSMKES